MGHEYIAKSPLVGTEFFPKGMLFGGAYASDGKRLCEFLGVTELPEVGPGVSMSVAGQKLAIPAEVEARRTGS